MLYAKHLGLRGSYRKLKEAGDPKLAELEQRHRASPGRPAGSRARAIYRYFERDLRRQHAVTSSCRAAAKPCVHFPRQARASGSASPTSSARASRATPGRLGRASSSRRRARASARRAEELKDAGEYLALHALQALAVETAEASAEWLHAKLRAAWGFPDPPEMTMHDRFKARYRGMRYSFGYPACPELADQATLFRLLDGGDRRRADRGLHDGPRGVGLGARLPPPAGPLLRRLRSGSPATHLARMG